MLVTAEFEDIAEDVKAGQALFQQDGAGIVKGLEEVVAFLNDGAEEYVRYHAFVDADATAGKALSHTITTHQMTWVKGLTATFPQLPKQYLEGLTASKGTMRRHVYGRSPES